MNMNRLKSGLFVQACRTLLLPAALLSFQAFAETADPSAPPAGGADAASLPSGACPLNSGGPSLLGSRWRLLSVYGTEAPAELEITMEVGENDLKGFAGCNTYDANFQRVGHTGFKINKIDKGRGGCPIKATGPGRPTINVGDWEGSYIRTLQRAGSVQQEGNTLHFYNRSGEPSVIFAKKYGDGPAETEAVTPSTEGKPESGAPGKS
ncbi:META domain-containing protein [Candidatus Thiothrix sp. Deng01]|uniref:META domain-containing protein n=1 Tax=Candidatus Thiothrix phosphatis TaxID=3112415 RepID=A0ABU6D263_9GAMM|nr:META domain-containing protein [Candidatus Thiothrix sp. Deng01]MEB4592907.1 META domain-containing protein [Candidatus Thiothrix sp. Deng01]